MAIGAVRHLSAKTRLHVARIAAVHIDGWVLQKGASVMKFWIVSVAAVLSLMAMAPL
jgi:hypothetical protein